MKVMISQASIDEKGKLRGGAAGDQTSREVFVRDWYDGEWHTLLRPKSAELARKSAEAAIYLADSDVVGYDQGQRNTLHTQLLLHGYDWTRVKKLCETDCSAFVTACALCGGAKKLEYVFNAPATFNMVEKFRASGDYEVLTDGKYLRTPEHLQVGDILVKKGHTIIVVHVEEQ